MGTFFTYLLIFFILAIVGFVLYRLIRSSTHVVPQEERRVIYRLGRFNRVVGPGVVRIIPRLEETKGNIEVREHPVEVTVDGIFAFLVPNTFSLNLWVRTDPVAAAGNNHELLTQLVQIREGERQKQVEVKMRDALIKQAAELQQRFPLPPNATTFDGIVALAPGGARYTALVEGVTAMLRESLPTIGVILSNRQPISLTRRGIPDDIINELGQKRGIDIRGQALIQYASQLRGAFPDMSEAVIAQILGSIPGVDTSNIRSILMEQTSKTGGKPAAKIELEMHQDGSEQINLQTGVESEQTRAAAASKPAVANHGLSDSDLSVLKRIPRRQHRKSA